MLKEIISTMLTPVLFQNQLRNLLKNPEKETYLLAVSGGADSMVLAYLFTTLRISGCSFQVAHVNYKLRGEDSELDQKTVEDFCREHKIQFHLYEVSEKDQKPENSVQLWARELRYRFFSRVQKQENLTVLATAHHLNDQLETFIINLSKASGIHGLSGIPANENHVVRPLLNFTKDEIYAFARENKIKFREDLSNRKSDYLRNKIRNEIVPKLLETNDHFLENFQKSLVYLSQTKDFVRQQIEKTEDQLLISSNENIILDKEKLNRESDWVKFEILKKYGFRKSEEIQKIFTAETGSSFYSAHHQLIINRNELIFQRLKEIKEETEEVILMQTFDGSARRTEINLATIIDLPEETGDTFRWEFDAEKVIFPLKLRRKKEGDYFYPIGMTGKKKISKFFKDEKMSILAKQKIWLLTDGNNNVLGIIRLRQDKRYARDERTKSILTIFNEK